MKAKICKDKTLEERMIDPWPLRISVIEKELETRNQEW